MPSSSQLNEIVTIFTARKRNLRRLCFHRCLSVHEGGCMAGGMCGRGGMCSRGACMAGGVCVAGGGHVLQGACMAHMSPLPQQILRDTVNERAVRILLECILVINVHYMNHSSGCLTPFYCYLGKRHSGTLVIIYPLLCNISLNIKVKQ